MLRMAPVGTLLCLILLTAGVALSYRLDRTLELAGGQNVNLSQLPLELGEWRGVDASELDVRSQDILQLDEYLRRQYTTADGRSVFVYVGYWKRQSGEHQAAKHSPLMCFPANGILISNLEERLLPATVLPAGKASEESRSNIAVSRLLATGQNRTSLYYYWFFSGEETYRDEIFGLLHIVREMILHGRSDGGIVEISAPVAAPAESTEHQQRAEQSVRAFAAEFVPALAKLVHSGGPPAR